MIELVTGSRGGVGHVTAMQDSYRNALIFGRGLQVGNLLERFSATLQSANSVLVGTGVAVFDGRFVVGETSTEAQIASGTAGYSRTDLIGLHYYQTGDGTDDDPTVEHVDLQVIQGAEENGESEQLDPEYNDASVLDGATDAFRPLYRVHVIGVTVSEPEAMFEPLDSCAFVVDGSLWYDDQVHVGQDESRGEHTT